MLLPSTRTWRYATLGFRIFLAIVFLVAGLSKVFHPWIFVNTVENYKMLPTPLARLFGLALPWIEVLLGVYLLIGLFIRVTALATAALLLVFLAAIGVQIANGTTGNCGCVIGLDNPMVNFFVGGNSIGPFDLVRDGILLLFCFAVALVPRPLLAVDGLLAARRLAADEESYEDYEEPTPESSRSRLPKVATGGQSSH